ncbi:MAG: hypothetical protein WCS89_00300 [Candidatus Paceibacterota bacterium]|jgi:hypothetical protein
MSLQDHIENLRAKPEHIRKRYSFSISLGVTAIIFAFWISSFGGHSNDVVATAVNKIETPGRSMIASVGSFFVDIRDIVFGPKKVNYTSTVEVKPGRK